MVYKKRLRKLQLFSPSRCYRAKCRGCHNLEVERARQRRRDTSMEASRQLLQSRTRMLYPSSETQSR